MLYKEIVFEPIEKQEKEVQPCGSCKACCYTLQVDELNKPQCRPCKFSGPLGCKIYRDPNKPAICDDYQCLWKYGMDKSFRPDRSGIILEQGNNEVYGAFIVAREVRKNTRKKNIAVELINNFLSQGLLVLVVLFQNKGQKLLMPHNYPTSEAQEILERLKGA